MNLNVGAVHKMFGLITCKKVILKMLLLYAI